MNLNSAQTGQFTPIKTPTRIAQCSQIVALMRQTMTKANAKVAEQKRLTKPLLTASIANKFVESFGGDTKTRSSRIAQAAESRHRDTTYHALALSMPMQSQILLARA